MNPCKIAQALLVMIVGVWAFIAIAHVFYNISKIVTDEKVWLSLSDERRRQRVFGDLYILYSYIDTVTARDDKILVITADGKPYFYGRYYLYPKKIYWDGLYNERQSIKQFSHLVVIQPLEKRQEEQYDELLSGDGVRRIGVPGLNGGRISLFTTK